MRLNFIIILGFFINLSFVFAKNVKIVGIVNDEVITSYDLQIRYELSKMLMAERLARASELEIKSFVLDSLIREKLLKKQARESNFVLLESEIVESMNNYAKSHNVLRGKNLQVFLGKDKYQSLKNQIEGEMIFGAILQSYIRDKIHFSQEEITRFMISYNENNQNKISLTEAKNMLISMKYNEVEQNLTKTLQESSVIEKMLQED